MLRVSDLSIGTTLENRYKLVQKLGEGGCAVIWEVEDLETNGDRKAIKVCKSHEFKTVLLLRQEFLTLQKFQKDPENQQAKYIVQVENLYPRNKPHRDDRIPLHFFVMEKITGCTLENLILKSSQDQDYNYKNNFGRSLYQFLFYRYSPLRSHISYLHIANWLEQLTKILQYLHSQQIIYCDLKPANIMITDDGNIKLIDFGVIKIIEDKNLYLKEVATQSVKRGFTLDYAAPEQMCGQALLQSDFYSLGQTLLFAATGLHPSELEPNWRSQFPPQLRNFLDKATQEDSLKRHPDADNLLKEAKQVTRSLRYQFGRWAVAKQMLVVLGIAAIATVSTLAMRSTGLLQNLEFATYDQMLRMRPALPPDPHLLIVAIKPEDYTWMGGRDISNATLTKTIQRLLPYQPRVIGIGVARDQPDQEGMESLSQLLQQHSNIFGSCEHSFGKTKSSFSFVPTPAAPLGFGTSSEDIRRQILAYRKIPQDKCSAKASFNLLVAHRYLNTEYTQPIGKADRTYPLGFATFPSLELGQGAYQDSGIDKLDKSFQILIDYRSQPIAETISLTELMTTDIAPQKIRDRIVLIGRFDVNADPPHPTPMGSMFSVELRAQMISQLVNTAKGKRPVLRPASFEIDLFCIVIVAGLSSFGGWRMKSWRGQGIFGLSLLVISFSGCLFILTVTGLWIVFVPTAMAAIVANLGIFLYNQDSFRVTGKA